MKKLNELLLRAVSISTQTEVEQCLAEYIRNYKVKDYKPDIQAVIDDLNMVLKSHYRVTPTHSKLIVRWLKQGYTLEDFMKIHRYKYQEWKGSDQRKYLQPVTLYGLSHFEPYLDASHNITLPESKEYQEEGNAPF